MSPLTAQAVSMALVGGVAVPLVFAGGLLDWAALVAWGVFVAAGADMAALRKTIPDFVFGALLAWVAMMLRNQVDVAPGSMLWMPRAGIAAALTLLVLGLAAKVELISYVPATLAGFGAIFGALSVRLMNLELGERLTGMHLYNPLIQVSLSMAAGAVAGLLSTKLADSLSKK